MKGATKTIGAQCLSWFVSIHAPNEGSDTVAQFTYTVTWTFQSTLPMKGATPALEHISDNEMVSIHAPNEGSDEIPTR